MGRGVLMKCGRFDCVVMAKDEQSIPSATALFHRVGCARRLSTANVTHTSAPALLGSDSPGMTIAVASEASQTFLVDLLPGLARSRVVLSQA